MTMMMYAKAAQRVSRTKHADAASRVEIDEATSDAIVTAHEYGDFVTCTCP